MKKSRRNGEEEFANVFQFKVGVPVSEHAALRDYLYKFAFNYDEAKQYRQILAQISKVDVSSRGNLLQRTSYMAMQCLALSMRRLTDNAGKRSSRQLVRRTFKDEYKELEIEKIDEVYKHYKRYTDRIVAHQDKYGIIKTIALFPDVDIIDADMNYLGVLYAKLTTEICSSYISIDSKPDDYRDEINKLRI